MSSILDAVPAVPKKPMTAERTGLGTRREQGMNGCPDGIKHFGVERAHDGGVPPQVVWFSDAPRSSRGHTGGRRIVSEPDRRILDRPHPGPCSRGF